MNSISKFNHHLDLISSLLRYLSTVDVYFSANSGAILSSNKFYCKTMYSLQSQNEQELLLGRSNSQFEDLNLHSTSQHFNCSEHSVLLQQFISEISPDRQVFGFVPEPEQNNPEYSCQGSQAIRGIIRDKIVSKKSYQANQKNSNTIKKIGRVIMDNLQYYCINGRDNKGVTKMLQMMDDHQKGHKKTKAIDSFNISHLKALFDNDDSSISLHNRRVTYEIFSKKMRKSVLKSCQIKNQRKLIYLKTFKCSSLRLSFRSIAHRLSASQK